jgi:hypothetical protein
MKDARPALIGTVWLILGLSMILWPMRARALMDGHADWFKKGSWHPLRDMPSWLIRTLGAAVCVGAALFFYIFIKSN